ncbi:hypothetical protein MSG28_008206 [Choristoneura fumiferana]|uniref:Uncharacterized protein n=1 Tax=Choristoneura fumiferana TaxID=7141 RepID=A0ACC0JAK6_CHOFU|nr:hypothetical protein MSG28_008206 [Choristoneura fumiferana]
MNITTTRHFTVLETNSLLPYSPRNGWLREDSLVLYHHHSRGCRASLYTIEDQIVSCKTEHNHESVAMPSRDLNTYSQPYFFSTTSKGSRFLIIDGYKYHLHKSGTGTVTPTSKLRWRCSKFRTGCKAIAHTVLDEIITIRSGHNHPPA